jgi:hypothetical protein
MPKNYHDTRLTARRLLGTVAIAALIAVACLAPACDDDGPTQPKPATDYPFYFLDPEGTPQLFKLYPIAQRIDSAVIPFNAREGITVSADGRRLYLADRNQISVINAEDYSLITQLPYQPDDPVGVSPDNQLIAIANGGLHLLRSQDYSPVFGDTVPVIHCEFSADSKTLYCAQKGTQNVYRVDLSSQPYQVSSIRVTDGLVYYVIPTADESKLLLYNQFGTFQFAFQVYNLIEDSIVFTYFMSPGYGQIAVTPDDKYAFFTSPGRSGTDPPGPPILGVFDIQANTIDTVIEDLSFFSDSTWAAWPNKLAVTPEDRFLGILGGSLGLRVIYLYDIKKRSLVFREAWGGSNHVFNNISAQSHLQSTY